MASKLDKNRDWILLHSNMQLRPMAVKYFETFGTSVSHGQLARFLAKERMGNQAVVDQRAEMVVEFHGAMIKSDLANSWKHIRDGIDRAFADGDERGLREWILLNFKLWEQSKLFIPPDSGEGGEEALRKWARRTMG